MLFMSPQFKKNVSLIMAFRIDNTGLLRAKCQRIPKELKRKEEIVPFGVKKKLFGEPWSLKRLFLGVLWKSPAIFPTNWTSLGH